MCVSRSNRIALIVGRAEKIFWKRRVKVLGDIGNQLGDPVFAFELVDRVEIQPTLSPVRHKIEDGFAVPRHDDRLAFLDPSRELGQPGLSFPD